MSNHSRRLARVASVYDAQTGDTITTGLRGCVVCDEAIIAAQRIADEWAEPVELEDDDGRWLVHPMSAGQRQREPADYLGPRTD